MYGTTSSTRRKVDSDRRDRDKDRDRDRDSPRSSRDKEKERQRDKDKDKDRKTRPPHSTRKSSSASTKERDRNRDRSPRRERRPTSSHSSEVPSNRSKMSIVPEMERRPSLGSTRVSSYPSFSKAHSKEAIGSKENIVKPRMSLYTPEPTDLGSDRGGKETAFRHANESQENGPPSPPLTNAEPDSRRPRSGSGVKETSSRIRIVSPPRASKLRAEAGPRHSGSSSSLRRAQENERGRSSPGRSRASSEAAKDTVSVESTEFSRLRTGQPGTHSTTNLDFQTHSNLTQTTDADSTATSVPPAKRGQQPPRTPTGAQSSPLSIPASSPRTPTPNEPSFPSSETPVKQTPAPEVLAPDDPFPSPYSTQSLDFGPPPPPPPPPVPQTTEIPRVDYLLQNGGLPHTIPRRFTSVLAPVTGISAQYPSFVSPNAFGPQHADVRNIFAPLQGVLDKYLQVMSKNGSLAVATGYRSVARRLLDRLEAVFNRNISSEVCHCIMCEQDAQSEISEDENTGLSWGEVLEHVSGRRDLPSWPPFTIESDGPDLRTATEAPMQKMDVDIAPEYRDHFIRQSKKTKDVVQAWLASQPEARTSPPQEVDDETLIFAVVTHLEPENRKIFTALLRGMDTLPQSRAPTPAAGGPSSDLMKKTALALQRLYRLNQPPRDAECSLFLLKNPELHGVLATLAAISSGEWDVLVSGRFDGFLWSGADSPVASRNPTPAHFNPRNMTPGIPSRGPTPFSRGNTPFTHGPQTRGPTPGPGGAPVQMDEDTEVAVLAEVEREIYAGMDALEDAFEALHAKAEEVREALRARNAGLSMAAARRRGFMGDQYDPIAVSGTPSFGIGQAIWAGYGDEEGDWNDDTKSEIRPDDSASNISFNRRRRRHRSKERRTPAPVEEEDEDESVITEEYVKPRRM
jgi:hypothetical protein